MRRRIKFLIGILSIGMILTGGWLILDKRSSPEIQETTVPIDKIESDRSETETDHFIVYCSDSSIDIKNTKKLSEEACSVITKDIGLDPKFIGENKVKIYIYQNRTKYQEATDRPSWSIGCNDEENLEIHHMNSRLRQGIPHELTHFIFKANFPPKTQDRKKPEYYTTGWMVIPNWIHEGFAVYEEKKFDDSYVKNVLEPKMEPFKQGKYLGIRKLTETKLRDKSLSEVRSWYAESLSVVTYLLEEYGKPEFFELCSYLADGMELDNALNKTYPGVFDNSNELTEKWSEWIKTSI